MRWPPTKPFPILGDYGAVVSPQQLKCALILKNELRRVEEVLQTHDRYPLEKLHAAVQRVRSAGKAERMRYAARYFIDICRASIATCARWRCWSRRWSR